MCIVVVKPMGSDFPSLKTISNCMQRNPDGFAFAWNENGQVRNFKSMDYKEALMKYAELRGRLDPKKTCIIVHARIATHGSKKVENCHCWIKDGIAFAHNGVLRNIPVSNDRTDSETFFTDYFLPVFRGAGIGVASNVAKAIAEPSGSKFAFLDRSGKYGVVGNYINFREPNAKGSCYYSNNSFRDSVFSMCSTVPASYAPGRQHQKPETVPAHVPFSSADDFKESDFEW